MTTAAQAQRAKKVAARSAKKNARHKRARRNARRRAVSQLQSTCRG
jgi:hypothetical protein